MVKNHCGPAAVIGDEPCISPLEHDYSGKAQEVRGSESQKTCL
jgi:hypothetical protein